MTDYSGSADDDSSVPYGRSLRHEDSNREFAGLFKVACDELKQDQVTHQLGVIVPAVGFRGIARAY